MPRFNIGVTGAAVIGCFAVLLTIEHLSNSRLREENASLLHRLNQAEGVSAENQRLAGMLVQARAAQTAANGQFRELMGLRAEVLRLRDQNRQLDRRVGDLGQAPSAAVTPPSEASDDDPMPGDIEAEEASAAEPLNFSIRLFKLHQTDTFLEKLKRSSDAQPGEAFQDTFRRYLQSNGVETKDVAGMALDSRTGTVIVRAPQGTLDQIGRLTASLDEEKP